MREATVKKWVLSSGAVLALGLLAFWMLWNRGDGRPRPHSWKPPSQTEVRALIADPECAFQKRLLNGDPRKLIEDYLLHDFQGAYLGSESAQSLNDEMLCPSHVPGFDTTYLVKGYRMAFADVGSEASTVRVEYEVVGKATGASEGGESYLAFEPGGRPLTEEFRLIHTAFGWRIDEAHPWKVGIEPMLRWQADPQNAHFRPRDVLLLRGLLEQR